MFRTLLLEPELGNPGSRELRYPIQNRTFRKPAVAEHPAPGVGETRILGIQSHVSLSYMILCVYGVGVRLHDTVWGWTIQHCVGLHDIVGVRGKHPCCVRLLQLLHQDAKPVIHKKGPRNEQARLGVLASRPRQLCNPPQFVTIVASQGKYFFFLPQCHIAQAGLEGSV